MGKFVNYLIETADDCDYVLGSQLLNVEGILSSIHELYDNLKEAKVNGVDRYVVKFPTDAYPVGIIFSLRKSALKNRTNVEKELFEAVSGLLIILDDLCQAAREA